MKKTLYVASILVIGAFSIWAYQAAAPTSASGGSPRPVQVDIEQSEGAPPESSVAGVVEDALPSVVNVRVTALRLSPFGEAEQGQGEGSGVIIESDGVILTNYHVVRDSTSVRVVLNNGSRLEGTVVGTSPEHDLAVVKVDATGLTPIPIGNSEKLRLGDEVIAIGFPLDLGGGPTVTSGIVSAKGRTINPQGSAAPMRDILQTDAAINPGNSGGPLLDVTGRLVGINSAAIQAGSAENIGFAIPVDQIVTVVRDIIENPAEERAWLGVQVAQDPDQAASQLGVSEVVPGAFVTSPLPESPAEAAGIRPGDIITAIDGEDINSFDDLTSTLESYQAGETVTVSVFRDGATTDIDIELEARPASF